MRMKKLRDFLDDKKIEIISFQDNEPIQIENRSLWSEIVIRKISCKICKCGDSITFHTKDIPKLIKAMEYFLKIQKQKRNRWRYRQRKEK